MKRTATTMMVHILLALAMIAAGASAQDETPVGWQKTMVLDFTTTQTAYSDSWSGGEAGSVNWVVNLNSTAEKAFSPKFNFKSNLRLSFGQTLTQTITTDDMGATTKNWEKPKKSTDLIDWENVGLFTLGKFVDPYVAFRLESQFLDASNEAKKLYFTPVKLTESAGMARRFYAKDKSFITSRLGVAMRQIISRTAEADLTVFDKTVTDGGLESVTDAEFHFGEKLSYIGKLSLFRAFYNSEKDDLVGTVAEDYWLAIDVNWENSVNAYITKIVTVKLYTQLLFDKEISVQGRFKETLGIGFIYRFI